MTKKKKYTLTPEHRARLPEWRDKWIANAMSTAAMTEDDRERCRDAVRRLYEAAGLKAPPPHRIVFVPSPFVATYAGGFAAWVWHQRKGGKSAAGRLPWATAMRETMAQQKTEARAVIATKNRTESSMGAGDRMGEAATETWGATAAATHNATARPTTLAVEDAVFAAPPLHRVAAKLGTAGGAHATNVRSSTIPGTTTETLRGTDIPVGRAVAAIRDATVDALEEAARLKASFATSLAITRLDTTEVLNATVRDDAMPEVVGDAMLDATGEATATSPIVRPVAQKLSAPAWQLDHSVSGAVARGTLPDASLSTEGQVSRAVNSIGYATWDGVKEAASEEAGDRATDGGSEASTRSAAMAIALPLGASQETRLHVRRTLLRPVAEAAAPWTEATLHAVSDATREAVEAVGRATNLAADRDTLTDVWVQVYPALDGATDLIRWMTDNVISQATDHAARNKIMAAGQNATISRVLDAVETGSLLHGLHTKHDVSGRTEAATLDPSRVAVSEAATSTATSAATWDATEAATGADLSRWWVAPNVHEMAALCGVGAPGVQCAQAARNMWQGGNQWSGYAAYLSFFRHVAQLPIDYTAWDAWETLARLSGPRIVHEDFCIISDRPEVLTMDDEHRPHAEHGPFCRWRDGTALYSWHGVRVPGKWIEDRATLTAAEALSEENLEVRRAACEIIGWDRILSDLNATTIDRDEDPQIGELVEVDLPDSGRERFLRVVCGTGRRFAIPVPPTVQTALEANAWTYGLEPHEYNPEFRT